MSETTWLTQDSYDRLKAEHDDLVTRGRFEIAEKIDAAREEGDLKENGGYHAAREEQAKQEARIRQLEELLRNAHVGEAPPDDGIVEPGMVVKATVGGEKMEFLLGSREVAGDTDLDVYSASSPMGAAITGKQVGDSVEFQTPGGATVKVEITGAKPFAA